MTPISGDICGMRSDQRRVDIITPTLSTLSVPNIETRQAEPGARGWEQVVKENYYLPYKRNLIIFAESSCDLHQSLETIEIKHESEGKI